MMVSSGSFSTDSASVVDWLISALPRKRQEGGRFGPAVMDEKAFPANF